MIIQGLRLKEEGREGGRREGGRREGGGGREGEGREEEGGKDKFHGAPTSAHMYARHNT